MSKFHPVQKPKHYNLVKGVDTFLLCRQFNFCKGNALKYIIRSAHKGTEIQDLKKAIANLEYEIKCLKK